MDNSINQKSREKFLERTKFQAETRELKEALESVANFVGEMGAQYKGDETVKPHWLTLSGVAGCGKTMLAKEAADFAARFFTVPQEVLGEYRDVQYRALVEMADEWREGCYRNHYDEEAWLLVVDDLGAERDSSGFIKDRIFSLLSRRLGKWTIITTNLKLKTIQSDYDVRIASRIIRDGNTYMPFKSGDWCLNKALERHGNE